MGDLNVLFSQIFDSVVYGDVVDFFGEGLQWVDVCIVQGDDCYVVGVGVWVFDIEF